MRKHRPTPRPPARKPTGPAFPHAAASLIPSRGKVHVAVRDGAVEAVGFYPLEVINKVVADFAGSQPADVVAVLMKGVRDGLQDAARAQRAGDPAQAQRLGLHALAVMLNLPGGAGSVVRRLVPEAIRRTQRLEVTLHLEADGMVAADIGRHRAARCIPVPMPPA